jgi:hypothetical protein
MLFKLPNGNYVNPTKIAFVKMFPRRVVNVLGMQPPTVELGFLSSGSEYVHFEAEDDAEAFAEQIAQVANNPCKRTKKGRSKS